MKAVEKVELQLKRIEQLNPSLHSMITAMPDEARAAARIADQRASEGVPAGLLHGLTVSFKDSIDVKGVRCTGGSQFYRDRIAEEDSPVAKRLRDAGAILIGKANLHELSFASTTQNPFFGSCRNPWNTETIPGGSSGGSAASVAAGMCDVSLGTDGGGSIRGPSAFNGVVGFRPTIGRVPNKGSLPVSPIFDTIGPIAHTVRDVASVYEVIAGYDPEDETTVNRPVESWESHRVRGLAGLKLGVPRNFCFERVDPEIAAATRRAISTLGDLGIGIVDIDVSGIEDVQREVGPIMVCDAASFHREKIEKQPELLGRDIYDRFMLGYHVTGIDYAAAMRAQERWRRSIEILFEKVDVIATPTVDRFAPKAVDSADVVGLTRALTRLVIPWSFAQVPAISVPCGFSAAGMPIGLQLISRQYAEALLFAVADAYQSVTDHHLKRPPNWLS